MTPSSRKYLALVLAPVLVLFGLDPVWGQRIRPITPRPAPPPPVVRQPITPPPPVVRPPIPPPAPIVRPAPITPPNPIIFNPPPPIMPNAMEQVWTCPTCKREVGRGMMPPASVTCCGKTYTNGRSLPSRVFGPTPNPTFAPSPDISSAASTAGGVVIAMGIGLILFGLLVLGGVGFLVVQSQQSAVPAGKRRRKRREDS